jgi:hypothetical protein
MNHEEEYKAFIEFMGGKVPNPEQHPVQFEHAVRTFLFVKNYPRTKNPSTNFQGG